jgi:hypothetical protein
MFTIASKPALAPIQPLVQWLTFVPKNGRMLLRNVMLFLNYTALQPSKITFTALRVSNATYTYLYVENTGQYTLCYVMITGLVRVKWTSYIQYVHCVQG